MEITTGVGAARAELDGNGAARFLFALAGELRAAQAAGAAVLVVSGDRDLFGIPGPHDADRIVVVPGEAHALRGNPAAITAAVAEWLPAVL
ncbi:MAG: hypothetical protein JO132_11155 [Streptosporangiaceae bacterium]|nr:hypothetical protein [Streptosporangiaceae bacterium]